jgi:endonuclease/exonuclease/phosphatase family metal-dependent hydrolase
MSTETPDRTDDSALDLRVVSWNLHGTPFSCCRGERLEAAARELVRRGPTLVLLQEVWLPQDIRRLEARLGEAGYEILGNPGGLWTQTGGLVAFLARDRGYTAAGAVFLPFARRGPLWRLWEGDALAGKGVLRLELRHQPSGQPLVALTAHLQARRPDRPYTEVRRAQLQQVTALTLAVETGTPVLFGGDLNTRPEDTVDRPLYEDLTGAVWQDLTVALRARCRCGTVLPSRRVPAPIWVDYLLARRSPRWEVDAHVTLIENAARDHPYSDHQGLDAQVTFRRAAGSAGLRAGLTGALDGIVAVAGLVALASGPLAGSVSRRSWLRGLACLALRQALRGGARQRRWIP